MLSPPDHPIPPARCDRNIWRLQKIVNTIYPAIYGLNELILLYRLVCGEGDRLDRITTNKSPVRDLETYLHWRGRDPKSKRLHSKKKICAYLK